VDNDAIEQPEIRKFCSECYRMHKNICMAKEINEQCNIGLNCSIEDLATESKQLIKLKTY